MEIDHSNVKAEVEAAFAEYELALVTNDIAMHDRFFLDRPTTIRYGGSENLYGYAEIAAFRAGRSPAGLARRLERTVITTYGRDFAVASTLFRRDSAPGKVGRLGAHGGRVAGRRRPCQRHRRAAVSAGRGSRARHRQSHGPVARRTLEPGSAGLPFRLRFELTAGGSALSMFACAYGIRPSAPVLATLIDRERGISVFAYDDRGMDITALLAGKIDPLYARFDAWPLNYDRRRMAEVFGQRSAR